MSNRRRYVPQIDKLASIRFRNDNSSCRFNKEIELLSTSTKYRRERYRIDVESTNHFWLGSSAASARRGSVRLHSARLRRWTRVRAGSMARCKYRPTRRWTNKLTRPPNSERVTVDIIFANRFNFGRTSLLPVTADVPGMPPLTVVGTGWACSGGAQPSPAYPGHALPQPAGHHVLPIKESTNRPISSSFNSTPRRSPARTRPEGGGGGGGGGEGRQAMRRAPE